MNITPSVCRELRAELEKVLPDIGKKMGLSIKVGKMSYTANNATMKLEAAVIGATGEVHSKEADAFKLYATRYGLKSEDLNTDFVSRGIVYTIIGLRTKAYKRPILGKSKQNGKVYIFPADLVVAAKGYKPLRVPLVSSFEDICGETGAWGEV